MKEVRLGMELLLIALILISMPFHLEAYADTYKGWPICANLTFTNDQVDVGRTLYNCLENIPSSLLPPSYFNQDGTGYHPTTISVQFAVNNLISVDDLQSQITLDYYFRCTWQDPRIYLPQMWQYLNPEAAIDGVVITPYYLNQNEALNLWVPDFYFVDSTSQEIIVETIKLRPNGTLYWSRHFAITISQPAMNFAAFPLDHQNFSIRFQSYAYDSKILQLKFVKPAIVFNTDPQNDNRKNIEMNVLWVYENCSAYAEDTLMGIVYNPTRSFYVGYANLRFTRASDGVVYRLGLPVTICLIVVGFSFWSEVEKRIEVTLQMLLVTAALYLVIGQIIPFVGYLTTMDIFVTVVFVCLALTVGINFFSLLLESKEDIRPMNLFWKNVLVIFLRCVWIPLAIGIYMAFFDVTSADMFALFGFVVAVMTIYACFQMGKIKESLEYSIRNLRKKAEFVQKLEKTNSKFHTKSESDAYGERLEKHIKLDPMEKFYLYLFRNSYLTSAKSDLNQKYVSRFSVMLKELNAEENAQFTGDIPLESMYERDSTMSMDYNNSSNNNNDHNNNNNNGNGLQRKRFTNTFQADLSSPAPPAPSPSSSAAGSGGVNIDSRPSVFYLNSRKSTRNSTTTTNAPVPAFNSHSNLPQNNNNNPPAASAPSRKNSQQVDNPMFRSSTAQIDSDDEHENEGHADDDIEM